jgi:transposase InsO family protein
MSSKTSLTLCTSCGRPTLRISKCWVEAGIISRRSWMIFVRFIVHWELCRTMRTEDVQRTIEQAMRKANLKPCQRPRLLSDNGACYVAAELKTFLLNKGITPVHGRRCHRQTQGKIERYHRSMKTSLSWTTITVQRNSPKP